jgi:hypothetical protein
MKLLSSTKMIFIGIGVLVVAGIAYWMGMSKKYSVRFDGRLPFFIEEKLNASISNYIMEYPARKQVFITAPYKAGKTRLLNQVTEELAKQGRLVFHLNLEDVSSPGDFLKMFRISTIKSMNMIKSTISSSSRKKTNKVFRAPKENLTEAANLPQQLKELYEGIYANLEELFDNFGTYQFHEINRLLKESVSALRPVIIVEGFDKLLKSKKYEKYYSNIHIIDFCPFLIELHDSSFKLNKEFVDSHRFIEIEAPKQSAEKVLVQKNSVFTPFEFKKIVSIFGEHAGVLSNIKESIRFGKKVDDAISIELNHTSALVNAAVSDLDLKKDPLPICSEQQNTIESLSNMEKYLPLIKSGLLYITNDMQIIAANKAIHNAFCA